MSERYGLADRTRLTIRGLRIFDYESVRQDHTNCQLVLGLRQLILGLQVRDCKTVSPIHIVNLYGVNGFVIHNPLMGPYEIYELSIHKHNKLVNMTGFK